MLEVYLRADGVPAPRSLDGGTQVDDATKIINAAAKRPRVEVKGSQRGKKPRNPYRIIEIVELQVPPCTIACRQVHRCYPEGVVLLVHPRQVEPHIRLYPGSYVLRHLRRPAARAARESGMTPQGHRDPKEFLGGKKVHR